MIDEPDDINAEKLKSGRYTTGAMPEIDLEYFNPQYLYYARNSSDIWTIDQHLSSVWNNVNYAKLDCMDLHTQIDTTQIPAATTVENDEITSNSRFRPKDSILAKMILQEIVSRIDELFEEWKLNPEEGLDDWFEATRLVFAMYVINYGYSLAFSQLSLGSEYKESLIRLSKYLKVIGHTTCQVKFVIELTSDTSCTKSNINYLRRVLEGIFDEVIR